MWIMGKRSIEFRWRNLAWLSLTKTVTCGGSSDHRISDQV